MNSAINYVIDNIDNTVYNDLLKRITPGSKISIAATNFSIYAYRELKKPLEKVSEFRFIYTSPDKIGYEVDQDSSKEFYIPDLYGTEFEIKLRNEMNQKALAEKCADWIHRKAKFKINQTKKNIPGFILIESNDNKGNLSQILYQPFNEFTTVDLGCESGESGNSLYALTSVFTEQTVQTRRPIDIFNKIWIDKKATKDITAQMIVQFSCAYKENSPEFIYFIMLYHIFSEFLQDLSEDDLPNEATGFKASVIWNKLYNYQKDAVLAIINKIEKYNGCILADSVGLGKTFTALAVIKYYESRNKSVLVLCPKKLAANWNTYKDNYVNNPISGDRLNYDVLFHTDLSRTSGVSNGIDLSRFNWSNYDLIVIDESHNFRNGIGTRQGENRYQKLINKVLRSGVKTKVLMLSATPVNNNFSDLENQLALVYDGGDSSKLDEKLNTSKSVNNIFTQARSAFKEWSRLSIEKRTTDTLLKKLDFDFFELLDSLTIARSRKHIVKYYNTTEIGVFSHKNRPISLRPPLTNISNLNSAATYSKIYGQLMTLSLEVYTPFKYILKTKKDEYIRKLARKQSSKLSDDKKLKFFEGRDNGVIRLMATNLLKRLESSIHSFKITLEKMIFLIDNTIKKIDDYENESLIHQTASKEIDTFELSDSEDLDISDEETEFFTESKRVKIAIADMDYVTWRASLRKDVAILKDVAKAVQNITPEHDAKLQELLHLISSKIEHPINVGNKKIIIFSAFSDTASYLYDYVSQYVKAKYDLNSALVTGDKEKTNLKVECSKALRLNDILTYFSPISKDRDKIFPGSQDDIDILIATDCISEGQNLQDCDYLVNYDIHWNPVRIIQRFGRIDRIGSHNKCIQLVNFWPDVNLDDYISLEDRVRDRMKLSILTGTGDDNPISEEKGDLEYRKRQLQRLQNEVIDIDEDSEGGISIMNLGLNEFRLDLLDYIKKHGHLDKKPLGLYAVVPASQDLPEGAIFILKNINPNMNINGKNRIHPFYMIYVGKDGRILCNYLNPKKLLDDVRLLCRGKAEPIKILCDKFNTETDNGKNMKAMSKLLNKAIKSIIDTKQDEDVGSLFRPGGTSALEGDISGLEDFELVCFFAVREL